MMAATQKIDHIQTFGPDGITVPVWCDTRINIHKINYVWIIHHFQFHKAKLSKGEFLKSSKFADPVNDEGCKWYLKLYPNGEKRNNENDAGLYLVLDPSSKYTGIFAEFEFSIFDGNQKTVKITVEVTFSLCDPFNNISDQSSLIKLESSVLEFRLSEDLGQLLKNEEMSDVILSVNGKEFKAHKTILTARSPVFAAMFKYENMKENQCNKVVITDLDEQVVEEMLNYIYTDKSNNLKKLADALLAASEKYGLDGLKKMSERVLTENLSMVNAIDMLILADLHRASELKSNAINYIVAKSTEVMNTTAWKNIAPLHLQLVIEVYEALFRK